MQDKSVFDFHDYKSYLAQALSPKGAGRGLRSRLAKEIGVQGAFVSQVVNQAAHFSLEHALKVSRFLKHTPAEAQYFMLLVELGRAGSHELREHYRAQLDQIQRERMQISNRLAIQQSLTLEDQLLYYSAWYYAAVHVLLSIPELQTKPALSSYLQLDVVKISEVLEFLCRCGLAREEGQRFLITNMRLHLAADSPLISRLHTNWRMHAIQALESVGSPSHLHYSSAITLSRGDAEKIRKILLDAIERSESVFRPSPEEVAYVFNVDFYPLRK